MLSADYVGRIERARAVMRSRGIDVLLLSVGADLPYFTGYEATPLERLTMAVIPDDGDAVLVVPELEAPRVEPRPGAFVVQPWGEMEDPVAFVAGLAGRVGRAAIGDQTWSVFLMRLQAEMAGSDFVPASDLTRELRMRKDAAEVAALEAVGAAADRVALRLAETTFSGRTERDISRMVADMALEEGHDVAAFAIVASGPNGASPHHEAGDREIGPGDAVVVDFGGRRNGYCSDTTRNFHVGEPGTRYAEAYAVLREAQEAAVAAVRPGVPASAVDAAARGIIADAGYGDHFIHRTGHGIGLEVHEHPYIISGNDLPLEPGMAFSVEPGIYLPGIFGMRIEDIVVVTADGVKRCNESPRGLVVVD